MLIKVAALLAAFLGPHWAGMAICLVAVLVVIAVLAIVAAKRPKDVGSVLAVLGWLKTFVQDSFGDKWAQVYDALIQAGELVANGTYSQAAAIAAANDLFAKALVASNTTLTPEEQGLAVWLLDLLVQLIVKDPPAAKLAFARKP
jgi:hypothetical protein